jgi:hypothetical protein
MGEPEVVPPVTCGFSDGDEQPVLSCDEIHRRDVLVPVAVTLIPPVEDLRAVEDDDGSVVARVANVRRAVVGRIDVDERVASDAGK